MADGKIPGWESPVHRYTEGLFGSPGAGQPRRVPGLEDISSAEDWQAVLPAIRTSALQAWEPQHVSMLISENNRWAREIGTSVAEQVIFQLEARGCAAAEIAAHARDALEKYRRSRGDR